MRKFASLLILSYKRPEMLQKCLDSLHETLDYPAEIIINIDGGVAPDYHIKPNQYSKVIKVDGNNRGVGRSLQNCLGVAEGDYIFKIDDDLVFKPKWLSTAVSVLDKNLDVGTLSLFDYRHYDPNDQRFNHREERPDCYIVDDFVSSIFGFRKNHYTDYLRSSSYTGNAGIPDDGLHQLLASGGLKQAITKEDYVTNTGFGANSVYLSFDAEGKPFKTSTHTEPLLFGI